ncbi:MAG TPA: LytTR family transcriptional regulator DNA-binding domain-containing protein [Terriglobales bacterium]|jgi:two-component system LytT family response regulator
MIRALIVDDESLAREALRDILSEDASFQILKDCKNGKEAVASIQRDKPDVVFLDVRMPVLDGFGVIERIGVENMPLTVFVTAYDQFAIKAFESQALDYVLKPFDEDRFRKTIDRMKRQLQKGSYSDLEARLRSMLNLTKPKYQDRLPVRSGGRIIFLQMSDIRWIEAAGNYLKFVTKDESVLMRGTMANLEGELDPERFIRIHRSTIVNVAHVKELRPWYTGEYIVIMNGGKELTLARKYRHYLKRFVQN